MGDLGFIVLVGLLITLVIGCGVLLKLIHSLDQRLDIVHKRVLASDLTLQRVESLYKIEQQLQDKKKKLENPTTSLSEFVGDLAESGCGMVRIDPQAIFIRGIRK